MEYDENRPIYLQIADYLFEKILAGIWKPDERIPSIRELAMEMEVNPNTVVRTFAYLQSLGIIYNKRGIGYFVDSDGTGKVRKEQKKQFFQQELPRLFGHMNSIGVAIEELHEAYERYRDESK
jgi:GntR family transcriptional regulator